MPEKNTPKKELFLEAYEAHSEAIFRHCYFRLFNRERAKEVMQDTFLRAWEQIKKGTEIEHMKAFLYRIATNLIIDDTRKKKADSLDSLQEAGFSPSITIEESLMNHIDGARIKEIVKKMDEPYREVILMRYVDDLGVKEIAEVLGSTPNVISVRIHRGLKAIKKIVASYEN